MARTPLPLPRAQEAAITAVATAVVHHLQADSSSIEPSKEADGGGVSREKTVDLNGTRGDEASDSERVAAKGVDKSKRPVLIQVDGPGTEEFVNQVARRLSDASQNTGVSAALITGNDAGQPHAGYSREGMESAGGSNPGSLIGATPKAALRAKQKWTVVWFDA